MLRLLRTHLSYANVMASLAVFLSFTGAAVAVTAIEDNSVYSRHVVDGQVRSPDIANGQVRSADVRNDTLTGGGLASADLASDSVGASEVADGSLTSLDVLDQSLTGSDVRDNTINADDVFGLRGDDDIVDNSLTGADVAEGSLGKVPRARVAGTGRGTRVFTTEVLAATSTRVATLSLPTGWHLLTAKAVVNQFDKPTGATTCRIKPTTATEALDVAQMSGTVHGTLAMMSFHRSSKAETVDLICDSTGKAQYTDVRIAALPLDSVVEGMG